MAVLARPQPRNKADLAINCLCSQGVASDLPPVSLLFPALAPAAPNFGTQVSSDSEAWISSAANPRRLRAPWSGGRGPGPQGLGKLGQSGVPVEFQRCLELLSRREIQTGLRFGNGRKGIPSLTTGHEIVGGSDPRRPDASPGARAKARYGAEMDGRGMSCWSRNSEAGEMDQGSTL